MKFRFRSSATIALIVLASTALARADTRPNILFFLSDDQRWDLLGAAGHPILKTPTMDRLAARGIRFENMFVTTSICAASRASILTGLHERTHGFTFSTAPIAAEFGLRSYPRLLKKAGYTTGFVGKFGVQMSDGMPDRMFDSFVGLDRNPYLKEQPDGSKRHVSELAGDHAIAFLKTARRDRPFCLSVSFNAPHAEDSDKEHHYPWPRAVDGLYDDVRIPPPRLSDPAIFDAHPEFLKKSLNRDRFFWRWDTPEKYAQNLRAYYRMITGIDGVMGRVLEALEETGRAENTIVIFSSDNGYYLAQRGFAGKWSHYEESLRVPLIVMDPRAEAARQKRVLAPMALNIDIPATILDYAGVEVPASYQGRSLKPWVEGGSVGGWRKEFFCEHLFVRDDIPRWEGLRGERFVYARYLEEDPPYEFLHDLVTDPDQLENLAMDPAYGEVRVTLATRSDVLRDRYGGVFDPEPTQKRIETLRRRREETEKELPPETPKDPASPNIVLILCDDMGGSDIGCYGGEINTPNLDRLAREGLRFTQFYNNAKCTTTRASIITGLFPRQGKTGLLNGGMVTIGECLKPAGYQTALTGKWHLGRGPNSHPFYRGFDDYYGLLDGCCNFFNPLQPDPPYKGNRVRVFARGDMRITEFPRGYYSTDDFTDHAIETVERFVKKKKPFFLNLCYTAPHYPLHAKPEDIAKYRGKYRKGWEILRRERYARQVEMGLFDPERVKLTTELDSRAYAWEGADHDFEDLRMAVYAAMVDSMDQNIGRLLATLDRLGIADNTIVMFLSDNGGCAEEPGGRDPKKRRPGPGDDYVAVGPSWGWAQNAPFRRYKSWLHEGGIATPFIVRWPGTVKPGTITREVGHIIDLLPTFNEIAGASYPRFHRGRDIPPAEGTSLLPILRGGKRKPPGYLAWQWSGNGAIRVGDWKLVWDRLVKKWELYDLSTDRSELKDLAERYPERVKELGDRWLAWARMTESKIPEELLGKESAEGTRPGG